MADKLILNADMICKADKFVPKKCTVENVIEVSDSEFRTFIKNPMKRNYYLPDSAKFVLKKFPKRHKKWYNIVRKDVREAHLLGEKENGKYKSNNRERTTVDTERIRDNQ